MEKGRANGTSPAAYPTWYIRSKKTVLVSSSFVALPLLIVDNSSFSPTRLTVHSNTPYDQETIPATYFKQRG